jgi:hypothetical protein
LQSRLQGKGFIAHFFEESAFACSKRWVCDKKIGFSAMSGIVSQSGV